MDLDTTTFETIEKSLCEFFCKNKAELQEFLQKAINFESRNWHENFVEYLKKNYKQLYDTNDCFIYFHTLTRRLKTDTDNKIYNLEILLLSDNSITKFCYKYGVEFVKNEYIDIKFNNEIIDYSNDDYLRYRLRGNCKRVADICVNGFLIRDNIPKYDNKYYNDLGYCPEFIRCLFKFLHLDVAIKDYYEQSEYYVYTYKVPLREVELDFDVSEEDEIYYVLATMCLALLEHNEPNTVNSNQINRLTFIKPNFNFNSCDFICKVKVNEYFNK